MELSSKDLLAKQFFCSGRAGSPWTAVEFPNILRASHTLQQLPARALRRLTLELGNQATCAFVPGVLSFRPRGSGAPVESR